MGELRERMQRALVVRGMSPRTQQSYLAAVHGLAQYYHQPPDTVSESQLQTLQSPGLPAGKVSPNRAAREVAFSF